MHYLTADHAPPPSHILDQGLRYPVAPLIRREDIHRLAALGVLRHVTAEGSAPLGHTPWRLAEDALGVHYYREPAGTPEERQAAIDAAVNAVPRSVSALQGMLAIKQAGLVPAFLAWKAALDPVEHFDAIAFIEKAQTWEYDHPVLSAGLAAIGVLEQKDALFRLAATL